MKFIAISSGFKKLINSPKLEFQFNFFSLFFRATLSKRLKIIQKIITEDNLSRE